MRPRLSFVLVLLSLAACSGKKPAPAAVPTAALPFIADDYAHALAEARARHVPLFVDVWANWCHTCLSLQQYVLPDPAMRALGDKFVWLSIDSERATNAGFLAQFPGRNLPTLWVIDGEREQPLLKWIGAATAPELVQVLTEAASGDQTAGLSALWLRGNRASAAGDASSAIALYREALQGAARDWPLRARTAEALSMRYAETHAHQAAFELAVAEADVLPAGTARLNVVLNGIDAGAEIHAATTAPDAFRALVKTGSNIAQDPAQPVLLDDRSTLYLSVVSALASLDPTASVELARSWATRLEAEAARASQPAARRVWDAHRLEAYMALSETQKAIPMLEQSERETPDDYNPPARLARAYLTIQRIDEARPAIERALARCDGPRKLRLYMLKSEIALASKDKTSALATLREALVFARDKKLGAQYDSLRDSIERKLSELS